MSKTDQIDTRKATAAKAKSAKSATDGNITVLPSRVPAQARPSDKVIAFVKRHPVVVVAGGIAVGAAVSALLPRGATRKWFGRAVDLAEAAGASSLLFGREAEGKVEELSSEAYKKASRLARKAEKTGGAAAESLERYGLAALTAASTIGKATARATARKAEALGDAAAEQSGRALHKVQELRERIAH